MLGFRKTHASNPYGISLSDVIKDGRDIGDGGRRGAARSISSARGICVNRVVRAQARDKLDFGLRMQATTGQEHSPPIAGSITFGQASLRTKR